jgi:hypothetical protein
MKSLQALLNMASLLFNLSDKTQHTHGIPVERLKTWCSGKFQEKPHTVHVLTMEETQQFNISTKKLDSRLGF